MKKYVKSATSSNSNAVAIATEVFGKWYREDSHLKIYKQVRGYAIKYYTDSPIAADNILGSMYEAADRLNISIIDSGKKRGYLGSIPYIVVYVVVPQV